MLSTGILLNDLAIRLARIRGVAGEGTAYLKVDRKILDEEALSAFSTHLCL